MRKGDRLPRIWSPVATQDLFDIWAYIANDATAAVADKQLHEIDRVCFALGAWPEYGRARNDVQDGLRSVSVSRYVVFYRVTKTAVEIVRVLDERRDVDRIFSIEG
jgi:plasmid stabilization system protein ParE